MERLSLIPFPKEPVRQPYQDDDMWNLEWTQFKTTYNLIQKKNQAILDNINNTALQAQATTPELGKAQEHALEILRARTAERKRKEGEIMKGKKVVSDTVEGRGKQKELVEDEAEGNTKAKAKGIPPTKDVKLKKRAATARSRTQGAGKRFVSKVRSLLLRDFGYLIMLSFIDTSFSCSI